MYKISILKAIDYERLDKSIAHYKEVNGENPYLFMNCETIETIASDIISVPFNTSKEADWYHDCRLYRNDDLEYGEVELR